MFCEKGVLRNFTKFTGKYLYQSPIFNIKLQARGLAQVLFFGEFCEISKNIFSYKTPQVAASES